LEPEAAVANMASKYIWLNGSLVKNEEATLHFLTPALHYGIGVFEGIRCYQTDRGPAIFRLREHIERLARSAHILGFRDLPYTVEELSEACLQTVASNGFEECYLRPLLYLAEGGWNLSTDSGKPYVGIAAWEWNKYLGEDALTRGVRMNVSSFTRHHPNVMMTKAKISGNYPNSVLAKTESVRLGFDDAIMLDAQGFVAECTGANIFVVRGKELVTPPAATVLEGITRETVITLAGDLGFSVRQAPLSRDELYVADEVFVTGTAAEVVGLREIDFRTIGAGKTGPVTKALQHQYDLAVHGKHARSPGWVALVRTAGAALPAEHVGATKAAVA
jgi:branched-chain amino acid aminotransferase